MATSDTISLDLDDLLARCNGAHLTRSDKRAVAEMLEQSTEWAARLDNEICLDELFMESKQKFVSSSSGVLTPESIQAVTEKIKEAKGELYLMQKRIRCCQSLLLGPSFIGRLSNEIMGKIFLQCTDVTIYFDSRSRNVAIDATGLVLMQVSSLWREILLTTVWLWNRISYTDNPLATFLSPRGLLRPCTTPNAIKLISLILRRSRESALDICIHCNKLPIFSVTGREGIEVVKALIRETYRWRTAIVVLACREEYDPRNHKRYSGWFKGSMPLLESLHFYRDHPISRDRNDEIEHGININVENQNFQEPPTMNVMCAPKLETVVLENHFATDFEIKWSAAKLVEIRQTTDGLRYMPLAEFHPILQDAKQLQHLTLCRVVPGPLASTGQLNDRMLTNSITFLSLSTFEAFSALQGIAFPHLSQVVVTSLRLPTALDASITGPMRPLTRVLVSVAPTLAGLTLDYGDWGYGSWDYDDWERDIGYVSGLEGVSDDTLMTRRFTFPFFSLVIMLNKALGRLPSSYTGVGDILPALQSLKFHAQVSLHMAVGDISTRGFGTWPRSDILQQMFIEDNIQCNLSNNLVTESINRDTHISIVT